MKNIKEVSEIYTYMDLIHNIKYMGIYVLEINDKYYVGETLDYGSRLNAHIKSLEKGTHHNIFLQKEFNKTKDVTKILCNIYNGFSIINHNCVDFERLINNIILLSYEQYITEMLRNNNKIVINIEETYNKIYNKADKELQKLMGLISYIISVNSQESLENIYDFIISTCNELPYDKDALIAEFYQLRKMKNS